MPDIDSLRQSGTPNIDSMCPVGTPDINSMRVSQSKELEIQCASQCALNITIDGGDVDFSHDTVMPDTLLEGVTAHNRLGQPIVGTARGGGADIPEGGHTGDLLAKSSDEDYAMEWITPANSAEQDNTRPITAAAVYTEIGNINALLATI